MVSISSTSSIIAKLSIAATLAVVCCMFLQLPGVDGFSSGTSAVANDKVASLLSHKTPMVPSTTSLYASSTRGIVPGVGEEGCNLPSVSGVNTKDNLSQAFVVKVVFLSLGAGTYLFHTGLNGLSDLAAGNDIYQFFRSTWPVTLGAVFALAGVTHFTLAEEYENIVPTKGAWGVWNIPGSRAFHVAWTGVAETVGGLGLLAGGLSNSLDLGLGSPLTSAGLESDMAAALFVLTLAVTPANIFMYTHGAKLPMDSDPLPLQFHAIRWAMQVVLLGFLYQMGEGTFQLVFS